MGLEDCIEPLPDLPTVANLRCGACLKRYNLPLLELILARGGCVVVDSTRRGKSLPDALSKTLPIWCAVLNRASSRRYGSPATAETCGLKTPKDVVSPSEHAQIEDRVEGWVEALLQSDLPIVKLDKPLRPLFVTPSRIDEEEKDVYPVVALSASVMVDDTPELVALSPSQHCAVQRRVQAQTQPRRTDDDDKLQRVELIDRQFIYVQALAMTKKPGPRVSRHRSFGSGTISRRFLHRVVQSNLSAFYETLRPRARVSPPSDWMKSKGTRM
ncbi:hypothetical protein L7F22_037691 [Adiantum nelumboides]|nr:hypothetical protein [Adiantum nelumboides]